VNLLKIIICNFP